MYNLYRTIYVRTIEKNLILIGSFTNLEDLLKIKDVVIKNENKIIEDNNIKNRICLQKFGPDSEKFFIRYSLKSIK